MDFKLLHFIVDYNYCLLKCLTGEVVAEYTGERISSEEAEQREITYQQEEDKHPPAMYYIYRGSAKVM